MRLRALLVFALCSVPSIAAADQFTSKVRVQGGVTALRQDLPNGESGDSDDYFGQVTPEVTYLFGSRRALMSATYAFTGGLHSFLPNEIQNRLALQGAFELAPPTTMLVGLEAIQSSLGNYLLVRRATDTGSISGIPAAQLNTQLLTTNANIGVSHELSSLLRLNELVSGAYITSIDPDIKNTNGVVTSTTSLDRGFKYDSIGLDARFQYARSDLPPTIDSKAFTAGITPHWSRDWSRTISTTAGAGVQVAVSPDKDTKPLVSPAGRASVLFHTDFSGVELSYIGGIEPNLLIGTLLQQQQATLRGYTPISEKYKVVVNGSVGYLRAKTVDLSKTNSLSTLFDAFLADLDLSWQATDYLQVFGRYQLIDQGSGNGPGATAALVRHSIIFGVEVSTRPPQTTGKVPTRFPDRVDRGDAAPPTPIN